MSNFYTRTDEQVKRRTEQVKAGAVLIKMEGVRKMCRLILDVKNKTDICFSFIQHIADFGVLNKEEMNDQMKMWKDFAKKGIIQMYASNNKEHDVEGKKVYTLVVNSKQNSAYCPLSLAWGIMVSGHTYAFTKKENRDAVYGYVKKFCEKESEE